MLTTKKIAYLHLFVICDFNEPDIVNTSRFNAYFTGLCYFFSYRITLNRPYNDDKNIQFIRKYSLKNIMLKHIIEIEREIMEDKL